MGKDSISMIKKAYEKIVQLLQPMSSSFSLALRKAGKHEGKNRRFGVAVIAMNNLITD